MVEYVTIKGEKVPKIKCDSVTTLKNKKTGKIYKSEEEIKNALFKQLLKQTLKENNNEEEKSNL